MRRYKHAAIYLMGLITMLAVLAPVTAFQGAVVNAHVADASAGGVDSPPETDSVIVLLLYSDIMSAIKENYDGHAQAAVYDATVIDITRIDLNFAYRVTVSVPTFYGPHNPPYGIEEITFSILTGNRVTLDEYKHFDVPN